MSLSLSNALKLSVSRAFPREEQAEVLAELQRACARGALRELDQLNRPEGASFNPGFCRVMAILIESAGIRSLAQLSPLLRELAEPADHQGLSPTLQAAVTLDVLRHLHQTNHSKEQRASTVEAARALVSAALIPETAAPLKSLVTTWLERYGGRDCP